MSGASSEEAAEKTHDPTPRRLQRAREQGEVASSADLAAAMSLGGMLLAAGLLGAAATRALGDVGMVMLGQADSLAPVWFETPGPMVGGLLAALAATVGPILMVPLVFGVLAYVAQGALVAAPSRLAPRLSRISPLSNAKHKFGSEGLFTFAKSTVKLCITAGLAWWFLAARLPDLLALGSLDAAPAASLMIAMTAEFLALAVVVAAVIGGADLLWQRASLVRRNRMSLQELREELKESDGDPFLRQERTRRAQAIATNRMMADVPRADVVIVNPTHYAVALRWDRESGRAPVCVAKGTDEVAARIRSVAAEAGVPIRHDPPTARALHATVALGAEIAPEHYRAVAAAIRFAEAIRRRARRRRQT